MILMLAVAAFLAICTFSMADMAWDITKRHGLGYAMGEWLAVLLVAGLALTAVLLAVS